MSERIVAVDPGDTTGYALGTVSSQELHVSEHGEKEWLAFCWWLYQETRAGRIDRIVMESWRLRPGKGVSLSGSALVPVQCIGAIRLITEITKTPLHVQEPAVKKVIDRMMGGTKYLPSGSTHAKDALRHLHYYFMTKKGITP